MAGVGFGLLILMSPGAVLVGVRISRNGFSETTKRAAFQLTGGLLQKSVLTDHRTITCLMVVDLESQKLVDGFPCYLVVRDNGQA